MQQLAVHTHDSHGDELLLRYIQACGCLLEAAPAMGTESISTHLHPCCLDTSSECCSDLPHALQAEAQQRHLLKELSQTASQPSQHRRTMLCDAAHRCPTQEECTHDASPHIWCSMRALHVICSSATGRTSEFQPTSTSSCKVGTVIVVATESPPHVL